jgi:hypothetical protein
MFALTMPLGEQELIETIAAGARAMGRPDLSTIGLAGGVLFAACHAYLATTAATVGWPLMLFTHHEGLLCVFLWTRHLYRRARRRSCSGAQRVNALSDERPARCHRDEVEPDSSDDVLGDSAINHCYVARRPTTTSPGR